MWNITVNLSTACLLHTQINFVIGSGILSVTIIDVTPVFYFQ